MTDDRNLFEKLFPIAYLNRLEKTATDAQRAEMNSIYNDSVTYMGEDVVEWKYYVLTGGRSLMGDTMSGTLRTCFILATGIVIGTVVVGHILEYAGG